MDRLTGILGHLALEGVASLSADDDEPGDPPEIFHTMPRENDGLCGRRIMPSGSSTSGHKHVMVRKVAVNSAGSARN